MAQTMQEITPDTKCPHCKGSRKHAKSQRNWCKKQQGGGGGNKQKK